MSHPDEAVQPVKEVESRLVSEAQARHAQAESSDLATDQEKKQAAVEQAHALSTRPDGSYAQLHESAEPTLAVAGGEAQQLKSDVQEAEEVVLGQKDGGDSDVSRAVKVDTPAAAGDEPSKSSADEQPKSSGKSSK